MIPRVIHRIWLGSDPMPDDFERYGRTWGDHHPDWEMRLWTDHDVPELRSAEALERCRHHGEGSDLVRYEVLLRFGGVYVDTDMECLRSLEPLMDVPAFAGETRPGKLGSAVLGSVSGHHAFEVMLKRASDGAGRGHVSGASGARLLTDVLLGRDDVKVFPPEIFYPFHHRRQPDREAGRSEAYAIHHVRASWKGREDLREELRRLRGRLERSERMNRELRGERRQLRKRLESSEAGRQELAAELDRSRRRLEALEDSRRPPLRSQLGRVTRAARRRTHRRSS